MINQLTPWCTDLRLLSGCVVAFSHHVACDPIGDIHNIGFFILLPVSVLVDYVLAGMILSAILHHSRGLHLMHDIQMARNSGASEGESLADGLWCWLVGVSCPHLQLPLTVQLQSSPRKHILKLDLLLISF